MSSGNRWLVAVGATLLFAAPSSAQQKSVDTGIVPALTEMQLAAPAATLAPTLERYPLSLGVARATAPEPGTVALAPAQGPQSTNIAMMIVGGAMMVVGSLVDGDTGTIIMVGGGAIGLVGLYRYLR